jgi:penicillin-binding protein 1A
MQLLERLTSQNVIEFARRMGITGKMDAGPAIALGTADVSLFEMVAAYSAFVNSGLYTSPFYILRIEDQHGNILHSFSPNQRLALDEKTSNTLVHMLKGGVDEQGGTSRGLSPEVLSDNEVGGKTGTTNDASDGWYIGITHNLVTGVWIGGEEPSIHLPSSLASGSRSALPVWNNFMKKVYAHREIGISKGPFKKDDPDISRPCEEQKVDSGLEIF